MLQNAGYSPAIALIQVVLRTTAGYEACRHKTTAFFGPGGRLTEKSIQDRATSIGVTGKIYR